jgi:hypothetical protein
VSPGSPAPTPGGGRRAPRRSPTPLSVRREGGERTPGLNPDAGSGPGSYHTARHGDPPPPRGSPAFVHRGEGMVTRRSSRKERSRGDGGEEQSSGELDASRVCPPGGVGRSGRRRSSKGVRAVRASMSPCRAAPRAARFQPRGGARWRCGPMSTRTEALLRLLYVLKAHRREAPLRPASTALLRLHRRACSGGTGLAGERVGLGGRGARLIRSPRRRWERQRREAAAARHAASGRSCDVLWLLAEAGGLLGGGVLVADPHGGCKAAAHGSATENESLACRRSGGSGSDGT